MKRSELRELLEAPTYTKSGTKLPIAFLVARYRSRSGALAHAIVISTFALPAS